MVSFRRSTIAAVGVGALLFASVPGAAQAAEPHYPPALTSVSCSAKAVSHATKIKIRMAKDLPADGQFAFRLSKKVNGHWVARAKQYKRLGSGETRTINVGKGKWRANCYPAASSLDSTAVPSYSNSVKIAR